MEVYMKKTLTSSIGVIIAVFIAFLFLLFNAALAPESDNNTSNTVRLTASEAINVVKDGVCDYKIVYSATDDVYDGDLALANALGSLFNELGVSYVRVGADTVTPESKFEILIGITNREYSRELSDAVAAVLPDDGIAWGIAVLDGKIYAVASSDSAYERVRKELFSFKDGNSFSIPADYYHVTAMTKAELDEEYAQDKGIRIEEMKQKIDAFVNTDFTQGEEMDIAFTRMPESPYVRPDHYPSVGVHPRLNITADLLVSVREYVEHTEEGQILLEKLETLAAEDFDGLLEPATMHTGDRAGLHNVNEKGLAIIEARAFLYLVTGDEEYGYNAILTMKNFFKTFELVYITSDMCREFGRVIFTAAEVYDWCYYLLSETDKEQFIIGMTYIVSGDASVRYDGIGAGKCWSGGDLYMEVGYPPNLQDSINGHGSEAQVLRDYFSASIAIFDENPTWYEYVGGRIYEEYIPFRNFYYKSSGIYPQGSYNYAWHRHNSDLWNAWMFYCMYGEIPYVPELQRVTNALMAFRAPSDLFFGTGDGYPQTEVSAYMAYNSAIVAALYGDKGMRDVVLEYYRGSFSSGRASGTTTEYSNVHNVIFGASFYQKTGSVETENVFTDVDPVVYNGYPIGEMITRREWNNTAVPASYMKIG